MCRLNSIIALTITRLVGTEPSHPSLLLTTEKVDDPVLFHHIESVTVCSHSGPEDSYGFYQIANRDLEVVVYSFYEDFDSPSILSFTALDRLPGLVARSLPSKELHTEWESLVFEDTLPQRLLQYTLRMVTLTSASTFSEAYFNWNRLCLLHGPPGSGKSTLCRAIAQKMSIRLLGGRFRRFVLIEIDTSALLSKYFGESGKLIREHFDCIRDIAEDDATFVFIVIDEIESLATCREKSVNGNECTDGLRATNQLLTALDRLRHHSNLVLWCTSNLIDAIDPAFMSRVDVKQYVPCPTPCAVYGIFRSALNSFIQAGVIDICHIPSELEVESWVLFRPPQLPIVAEAILRQVCEPYTIESRLWTLSQRCVGLSGRTCRRLPLLGLAMHTWATTCSLEQAFWALEAVADEELRIFSPTTSIEAAYDSSLRC